MRSLRPARASSTELSTISCTRWWRPRAPVEPMYMPGRLRTASRPSRTWMSSAPYWFGTVSEDRDSGSSGTLSGFTDVISQGAPDHSAGAPTVYQAWPPLQGFYAPVPPGNRSGRYLTWLSRRYRAGHALEWFWDPI